MRTPTPKSASMSTSSGLSGSSRSSSSSDFSDVDPRRFFTNSQSDGDLYSHLHRHHEGLRSVERGYSDSALQSSSSVPHRGSYLTYRPSGLGLEVTAYDQFDPSSALVSPRYTYTDESSSRQLTHPLPPLDVYHHHQQPPLHRQPPLPDGTVSSDAFLYYEQLPHNPYDPMHPSQWQSFYPGTHRNNSSSAYQLQHSAGAYSELTTSNDQGGRTPSSFADFLTLPTHDDAYTSSPLGHSPQDSVILSPHEIGPIFSDAFISEPLTYDDLGSSSNSGPRIDFESFRQGIISPALSEATPTEFLRQVLDPEGLANPAESPLLQDYSPFDSFDDDEVGSELSLFGGLGVAEGDFDNDASLFANADSERTPRHSPRGFAIGIPPAPQPPERPTRMPPTPRLSPLLSSF